MPTRFAAALQNGPRERPVQRAGDRSPDAGADFMSESHHDVAIHDLELCHGVAQHGLEGVDKAV